MIYLVFTRTKMYVGIRGRITELLPIGDSGYLEIDYRLLPETIGEILPEVEKALEIYLKRVGRDMPIRKQVYLIHPPEIDEDLLTEIKATFEKWAPLGWDLLKSTDLVQAYLDGQRKQDIKSLDEGFMILEAMDARTGMWVSVNSPEQKKSYFLDRCSEWEDADTMPFFDRFEKEELIDKIGQKRLEELKVGSVCLLGEQLHDREALRFMNEELDIRPFINNTLLSDYEFEENLVKIRTMMRGLVPRQETLVNKNQLVLKPIEKKRKVHPLQQAAYIALPVVFLLLIVGIFVFPGSSGEKVVEEKQISQKTAEQPVVSQVVENNQTEIPAPETESVLQTTAFIFGPDTAVKDEELEIPLAFITEGPLQDEMEVLPENPIPVVRPNHEAHVQELPASPPIRRPIVEQAPSQKQTSKPKELAQKSAVQQASVSQQRPTINQPRPTNSDKKTTITNPKPNNQNSQSVQKTSQKIEKPSKTVEKPNRRAIKSASFPGGESALISYLRRNLNYPKSASRRKLKGYVEVRFRVDIEGNIHNPYIVKSLGSACDSEALRLVENMPSWLPATEMRKRVASDVSLNIAFGHKI